MSGGRLNKTVYLCFHPLPVPITARITKYLKKYVRRVLCLIYMFSFYFMGPLYEVYISQMIRYSKACGSYQDFLDRGLLVIRKLLNQGFLLVKFGISVSQMTTDMFYLL